MDIYKDWMQKRVRPRSGESFKPQTTLLTFYHYLKEHKIKGNLLQGIDYIEDEGGGYFNTREPEQIVVRNLKLIKLIETDETKTTIVNQLSVYSNAIVAELGTPFKVEGKKHGGKVVGRRLVYKPIPDFKPINFIFYPNYDGGVQEGWTLEAGYQQWYISGYHKGPDINFYSKKLTIEREDSLSKVVEFVKNEYQEYAHSNRLVEDKWNEHNVEYFRERLQHINPISDSNMVKEYGVKNEFLYNYVSDLLHNKVITDEDLLKEIPLFQTDTFEVLADDYNSLGSCFISNSGKRSYKEIKSKLPEGRFSQFISGVKARMEEFLTKEQIADIFRQLES